MKKSKKIMFGIAVAAVASLNVKIANNIQDRNNAMSLVNLENITEAQETSTSSGETVYNTGSSVTRGENGNIVAVEYLNGSAFRTIGCKGESYNFNCSFTTIDGKRYTGSGDPFVMSLR